MTYQIKRTEKEARNTLAMYQARGMYGYVIEVWGGWQVRLW